jgi:hypothetical protein
MISRWCMLTSFTAALASTGTFTFHEMVEVRTRERQALRWRLRGVFPFPGRQDHFNAGIDRHQIGGRCPWLI